MAERIEPQAGPQTQFLKTLADIAIYGGGAGGGKTFGLLLEPLRHYSNSEFQCVTFRRTTKQVTNPGALWDGAGKLYSSLRAVPNQTFLTYCFPTGMRVQFAHLEHEKNVLDWQGAQVPLICFDELTHFTEYQFFYMLSRLRSDSGVRGYVRATCNPDVDSWVAKLIAWWINPETGLAIPERSGVIRWFVRVENELTWADTKEELEKTHGPECYPMSLTFIPAKLSDNPILLENNPSYVGNLNALPLVERMRLKDGNWKVRATAGLVFNRSWFKIVDAAPGGLDLRYWDRAATEKTAKNDPANTAGLKLRKCHDGKWCIMDVRLGQWSPGMVEETIKNTASQDTTKCVVGIEQDPGQAGIVEATQYVKLLPGYDVRLNPARKDKVSRALPVSAQAEAGNITLLRGPWNEKFLSEAENFPEGAKKDQVDALSGAFALHLEYGHAAGGLYVVG